MRPADLLTALLAVTIRGSNFAALLAWVLFGERLGWGRAETAAPAARAAP